MKSATMATIWTNKAFYMYDTALNYYLDDHLRRCIHLALQAKPRGPYVFLHVHNAANAHRGPPDSNVSSVVRTL